uniref:Uncharacterized protein n=1 Tax=viral metagenome TaxID=1070528 RepID=A0A6M3KA13_9ZZZZ
MAQEQVLNNEGIVEANLLLMGASASKIASISLIKTACSAATASGYSSYTQATEAGCVITAIATITASSNSFSGDTIHIVHPFTAGTTATIKGHLIANTDKDVLYSVCCYAGDIAVESGDTITVTHKIRGKNG